MTSSESTPLFQYYFRALICFAAAGTLAAEIDWNSIDVLKPLFVVVLLAYTYGAYYLTKRFSGDQLLTLTKALAWTDAGLIGVSLSLVNFSLLPCILFLTMIQFNALLNGGLRKWGEDNAAFLAGILLSFLIYEPQWVLSGTLEISAASLIGVITYFCAYALFTHSRMSKLGLETQRLEQEQQLHKMRTYKLSRYLPPPVWKAINEGRDKSLQTERKRLTVFFSDIKDFSELAEEMEAEALTDLLNTYLTDMTKIVQQFGGTIDKFMGDGIMVLFGDSASKGVKQDALRCVAMAIAMKKRMKTLQQHWHHQGVKRPLQIRMGINTGYCTVGTFGTANHLDYTALGAHVNLASRLESAAEPGEILVSHETWGLVKDTIMCRDKGNVLVKGFSHPIKVYQVVDLRKNLGANQSYFEQNLEGFTMYLDMEKIRNFDKEKVLEALAEVSEKLRDKIIP
ncbi:adenylate/guanylate cyclase domain-containing protein [Simiduia agarivorans]|uniref:Adenylate cyclase n=1 Tax=Simiduia agarivorans (strain DSM 21679 / JCM 13881 / BCRC 17597 / SA1) TaxID=1117647 RepID=K4KJ51_SIMAS|nr:adenylate/guanylate cyclase domain-containing protein [Simiduia agarivorans]AFU98023.1 putative adenylate cyclase [Simiduia agarivorans SA1 = DSM 21679]